MSLAHELIDAALAADLSQNALRVFLALFRQTLCYGKTSDPLTHKRLVTLTHIRKDRLIPALNALVEHRLFTVHAHKTFGQRYQIHTDFLANPASPIYAPHLTEKPNTSHHQQARLQSLALEIQALDRLYTLAGMAMDAKTAAKRQAYYEEYERLKQAVSSTCSYT